MKQIKLETDCYCKIGHAISMTDKDEQKIEFSKRFQRLINEKGWADQSREELGKRFGNVTAPAVTYWWNANRMPTMSQAIEIAIKLDCCVEWLLTGRGPMRPPPTYQDLIDISFLPDRERANYKALINTRSQQITDEKKGVYNVKLKQNNS